MFAREDHGDRVERDAAIADWLDREGGGADRARRLHGAAVGRSSCGASANRIVNVHPALLPSFPGLDAVGQALEHGVSVTGVTVHFVDEGVDSGPIILQRSINVPYTRDRSQLEREIHRVEHRTASGGDPH